MEDLLASLLHWRDTTMPRTAPHARAVYAHANMAETDFQTEQGIAKLEGLVDKVATQLRHAIQHDQTLLFLGI